MPGNRKEFLITTLGITAMTFKATAADDKGNYIIAEATKWSEVVPLLKRYLELTEKDSVKRVFGYGSLIWDHGALKTGKSAELPNEQASIIGANVDMAIYAVGPDEFRGSDKSVGLYVAMTATGNEDDVTNGLNVIIDPDEFKTAVLSFTGRELGNPPLEGMDLQNLFAEDAETQFARAADTDEDNLKMYTFQIVKTVVEDREEVSLVVSGNTQSIFYAKDITPLAAAHAILDGHGFARDSPTGGRPGGRDLDYFTGLVGKLRDRRIHHPKIEAIAEAVYRVAAYNAKHHEALTTGNVAKSVELNDEPGASEVRTRYYLKSTSFVKRPKVSEEEKRTQDLPQTGEEKTKRIAEAFKRGDFDTLAPHLAPNRSVNLR